MDHAGHHNGGLDHYDQSGYDDDEQGGFDDSQHGGGFDGNQQGDDGFDKHILDYAQHAEHAISRMIEDHRIEELKESWHQLEEFLDRITSQLQHLEKMHDHHCPLTGDEDQDGQYGQGQHGDDDENGADGYGDGEWGGDENDDQGYGGHGYGHHNEGQY